MRHWWLFKLFYFPPILRRLEDCDDDLGMRIIHWHAPVHRLLRYVDDQDVRENHRGTNLLTGMIATIDNSFVDAPLAKLPIVLGNGPAIKPDCRSKHPLSQTVSL